MNALDQLLGPGVVTATPDGRLRLDDDLLAAERTALAHRRCLIEGISRCWCTTCRAAREAKPAAAPSPAVQPWQPREARKVRQSRENVVAQLSGGPSCPSSTTSTCTSRTPPG